VSMAANQKEYSLHPKRASTVRQQNFQLRKINRDIVNVNWIAVLVARAGKDRSSSMKHDWDAVAFGCAVDDLEFFNPSEVVVGIEELVRRVNLYHTDAQPYKLLHVRHDVCRVPRLEAAAGKQAFRVFLHVVRDELIHARCEADHFRCYVIDKHG